MIASVIIVTKDRCNLLARALESVLKQRFTNFELVLVNDASRDDTEKVVFSIKDKFTNFTYIANDASLGVASARRQALESAQGDFVFILDDDDVWTNENKMSEQLKVFEKNNDIVLVGCYGELIDENNLVSRQFTPPTNDSDIRKNILISNCFLHSGVCFKRLAAIKALAYSDKFPFAEDYAMVVGLGRIGEMQILPLSLVKVRVNHNGLNRKNNLKQIFTGIRLSWLNYSYYPSATKALFKWTMQYIIVWFFGYNFLLKIKERLRAGNSV